MTTREESTPTSATKPAQLQRRIIARRSWGHWAMLAISYVVTTTGFGVVVAVLLPDQAVGPWPWIRTNYALVGACVFLVVTLVVYLSMEQRHINRLNNQLEVFQNEINEASRRRLYALLNVSRIMGLQSDLQNVFDSITRACVETFNCDQASLMLVDTSRKRLVVRSAYGHLDLSRVLGSEKEIGEGIAGWVAKHSQAVILGRDPARNPPELELLSKTISAAIVVPIILREELVGVINSSSRDDDVIYTDDDLHALKVFAENAGSCIRHAEQAEWMRKTIASLRAQVEQAEEVVPR